MTSLERRWHHCALSLLFAHSNEACIFLVAPRSGSLGALADLVLWLMAKSPEERVPNARVLLHAIRSL